MSALASVKLVTGLEKMLGSKFVFKMCMAFQSRVSMYVSRPLSPTLDLGLPSATCQL